MIWRPFRIPPSAFAIFVGVNIIIGPPVLCNRNMILQKHCSPNCDYVVNKDLTIREVGELHVGRNSANTCRCSNAGRLSCKIANALRPSSAILSEDFPLSKAALIRLRLFSNNQHPAHRAVHHFSRCNRPQ